ncbi:MAG: hypothetical protein KL787_02065 [Taibaiella sp.]|nr:hypothetical protein [Taibaiella sp.]
MEREFIKTEYCKNKVLGEMVFKNREKLNVLNGLVHSCGHSIWKAMDETIRTHLMPLRKLRL